MRYVFLTAITALIQFLAFAQNDSSLTKHQRSAAEFYQSFITKAGVKINKTISVSQFKKGLKDICLNDCGLVLAVEGLKLEGHRKNPSQAELTFYTLNETNNKGFVIQRNFKTGSSFDSVGFVRSAGNSMHETTYRFIDDNRESGNSFYRLMQIDRDGKMKYSNIVKIEGTSQRPVVSVIPNPATSSNIRLRLTGFENKNVQIVISNVAGKIIFKQKMLINSSVIKVDNPFVAPGFYSVRIFNEKENAVADFIVR